MKIEIGNIDWNLLNLQKRELCVLAFTRATKKQKEAMEGILNLLDRVQDEAAKEIGVKNVFGKLDDDEFICYACHRVFDVEDSVKTSKKGRMICLHCADVVA